MPWLTLEVASGIQRPTTIDDALYGAISPLLPYSVRVRNNGGTAVIGIDVLFNLQVEGKSVLRNFFYHTFSDRRRKDLLAPGEALVITPVGNVNNLISTPLEERSLIVASNAATILSRSANQAMLFLSRATEATAVVDLVITADGRYTGPDKARSLYKLQQEAAAYEALRAEVLARIARNDSDASLSQWLSEIATQRVTQDPETGFADRSVLTQGHLATEWMARLRDFGRDVLQQQLAARPKERVYAYLAGLKGDLQ